MASPRPVVEGTPASCVISVGTGLGRGDGFCQVAGDGSHATGRQEQRFFAGILLESFHAGVVTEGPAPAAVFGIAI